MKSKFSILQRIKYRFDALMSKGILPVVLLLFGFAALVTFSVTIILVVSQIELVDIAEENERKNILEVFWVSTMHIIDQGTITGDSNKSPVYRLIMLSLSLLGILLISILVGLLNNGISVKLNEMRKGRSVVIEEGHIVILGWSSKIFAIINELTKANENQKKSCIVILANKDKIEMDDEIIAKVDKGRTKIITRTGNPIDMDDLDIVNHKDAKSILIVPPDDEDNMTDAYTVKCILALVNHPDRKEENYNIVAEIRNIANRDISRIIAKDEVTFTLSNDIVARIAVQTCVQSGLSVVYNQLLEYSGVEIYFILLPQTYGLTFRQALLKFENASLLGIQNQDNKVLLNPSMDYIIREGDKIISISTDDDQKYFMKEADSAIIEHAIVENEVHTLSPTKILILGWNKEGPVIVEELGNYTSEGSELCIVAQENMEELEFLQSKVTQLNRLKVSFQTGIVSDRKLLNSLNIPQYDHVMILGDAKQSIQQADAMTLMTLMHLRNIKEQSEAEFTTVSEMLDIKNRRLAEVAKPDDFIISNHIVSLIMVQLAENKFLKEVFEEIFDAKGSEFYLKPVSFYLKNTNDEVNFKTIVASAAGKNEIAVGYRLYKDSDNPKKNYGIVVNPKKSERIRFSEKDKIVILSSEY